MTPTPKPTPSPPPAFKSINDLIRAPHPVVSAVKAKAAIKAAYAADSNAMAVYPYGITNAACFDDTSFLTKEAECSNKVSLLYGVYRRDGGVLHGRHRDLQLLRQPSCPL